MSSHVALHPAVGPLLDYTRLQQDLMKAVVRVCPPWLADRRDDLVQAAVMRVMQAIQSRPAGTEGDTALSASYLYKVAYSALIDELRRIRRRRETDLGEEGVERVAAAAGDPERTALAHEIGHGIQGCLARMNRERRLAVTLYLQGHSVVEAARILEWTPKQTENRVYRGLADLRRCLSARGITP